jgi:ferredoxin
VLLLPHGDAAKDNEEAKSYQLKVNAVKCIDCGKCKKVYPMQLLVDEIRDNPDCIK